MIRLVLLVFTSIWGHWAFTQCHIGLKVDSRSYYDTPTLTEIDNGNLPASASLKNYCPKPGNQLSHLTSAGWATSYYATTILYARRAGHMDLNKISAESITPTYTQFAVQGDNVDCYSPISLKESLDVLASSGAPRFSDYPYFCPDAPPDSTKMYTISGYNRLLNAYDPIDTRIRKIKNALHQGLPVVVALQTTSSFCEPGELWNPSKSDESESKYQAICIIGYDDIQYGGSFELVNSWGTDWGIQGFVHVPYKVLIDRISEAYTAFLLPEDQEFSTHVAVVSNAGSKMEVKPSKRGSFAFTKGYGNGHQFQFAVNTNFKGYLYLYYYNDRGESGLLFPGSDLSGGVLPYDSSSLSIPGNNQYIQLDNQPGKETMVIVLSKHLLSGELIAQASKENTNSKTMFDPYIMRFEGKINNDQPYAILRVELNHI